jgi:hypothetical protein
VTIRIDVTGDYRIEIYDLARRAVAYEADPDEIIETWRDGKPCMRGRVGTLARLTVSETDRGGPREIRWRPFPGVRGLSNSGKNEF